MMKRQDFLKYVDVYSADLSRWPVDQVKPALDLIEKDADMRAYFDAALKLDSDLRFLSPTLLKTDHIAAAVMQRIAGMEQASAPEKSRLAFVSGVLRRDMWLSAFAPGGGLLAAAVIGFFIGMGPMASQVLPTSDIYNADQIIGGDADIYERGFL
jgi:hypothetical protein